MLNQNLNPIDWLFMSVQILVAPKSHFPLLFVIMPVINPFDRLTPIYTSIPFIVRALRCTLLLLPRGLMVRPQTPSNLSPNICPNPSTPSFIYCGFMSVPIATGTCFPYTTWFGKQVQKEINHHEEIQCNIPPVQRWTQIVEPTNSCQNNSHPSQPIHCSHADT